MGRMANIQSLVSTYNRPGKYRFGHGYSELWRLRRQRGRNGAVRTCHHQNDREGTLREPENHLPGSSAACNRTLGGMPSFEKVVAAGKAKKGCQCLYENEQFPEAQDRISKVGGEVGLEDW